MVITLNINVDFLGIKKMAITLDEVLAKVSGLNSAVSDARAKLDLIHDKVNALQQVAGGLTPELQAKVDEIGSAIDSVVSGLGSVSAKEEEIIQDNEA